MCKKAHKIGAYAWYREAFDHQLESIRTRSQYGMGMPNMTPEEQMEQFVGMLEETRGNPIKDAAKLVASKFKK